MVLSSGATCLFAPGNTLNAMIVSSDVATALRAPNFPDGDAAVIDEKHVSLRSLLTREESLTKVEQTGWPRPIDMLDADSLSFIFEL